MYVKVLAGNWIDKSFKEESCSSKKVLWFITPLHSVLCLIRAEIIPHYLEGEKKGRLMRKTSLGQALSTQACFFCRCQCSLALDPDIKGLRESFPPFKAWAYVPAPTALIFATSLATMSWNYTLFKYLSPLVSQFFRTVSNPTLPTIPISSLLAYFKSQLRAYCQILPGYPDLVLDFPMLNIYLNYQVQTGKLVSCFATQVSIHFDPVNFLMAGNLENL